MLVEEKLSQISINKSSPHKCTESPSQHQQYRHQHYQHQQLQGFDESMSYNERPNYISQTPHRAPIKEFKSQSTIPSHTSFTNSPQCAMSEQQNPKKIYQFSFMKETSSSIQRRQNSTRSPFVSNSYASQLMRPSAASSSSSSASAASAGAPPPAPPPPPTTTTIPSIGTSSAAKKRLEYSRHLSHTVRTRRHPFANSSSNSNSNSNSHTLKKPSDITNIRDFKGDFGEVAVSAVAQRTTPEVARVTRTPNIPDKIGASEASGTTNKLLPCFRDNYHNDDKMDISPIKFKTTGQFNSKPFIQNQPQNVFQRLYSPRKPIREVEIRGAESPPRIQTPRRVTSRPKIESHIQLNQILYQRDPDLFTDYTISVSPEVEPGLLKAPLQAKDISLNNLNIYERGEVLRKEKVYYVPQASLREINLTSYEDNFGFDDSNGNYKVIPNDHIGYRYQVLRNIGNGSFGNVVLARDHKFVGNSLVAVKIINNNLSSSMQSVNEIKMLKLIRGNGGHPNVINFYNQFNFRSHVCIATELLSLNLYSLLEITKFQGLSVSLIEPFARQILQGLRFLHNLKIIHCDIKPENVMLKLPSDPSSSNITVKLIDFGSSCFYNEKTFTYIQSRFYRAPEIIIGADYDSKIDIWSVGCVLAELFTGAPLFPGKNEIDQVGLILEILGAPKSSTILKLRSQQSKSLQVFSTKNIESINKFPSTSQLKKTLLYRIFDINGKINMNILNHYKASTTDPYSAKKQFRLNSKSLEMSLGISTASSNHSLKRKQFLEFLQKMFVWDPTERASVDDLLNEVFIH